MSSTTININNIAHTIGTNTIIVGDIELNTSVPISIDIKPLGPQVTSHFILSKNDDTLFKSILNDSPVREFDINLYDQHGHISCCYGSKRKNNYAGTIKINESKDLLSNIEFPKIDSGQIYLVITHYDGMEQLTIPDSKRQLIIQDLELLKQKVDTKKIVLFISKEINDEINTIGINLNDTFQKVFCPDSVKLIRYMVEYIVGKNISNSKPSFQGMLKFDYDTSESNNINVVMADFIPYDSKKCSIQHTIRSKGRIQINSNYQISHSRFIIILTHSENYKLKLYEETTNTVFSITPRTRENLIDITDEHFNSLFKSTTFYEELKCQKNNELLNKFIIDNLNETAKYLFCSQLLVFEGLESKSDMSFMIINYGCSLQNQMYQFINNISQNNQLNSNSLKYILNHNHKPVEYSTYCDRMNCNKMYREYTQVLLEDP
jgi:hypothetical protein